MYRIVELWSPLWTLDSAADYSTISVFHLQYFDIDCRTLHDADLVMIDLPSNFCHFGVPITCFTTCPDLRTAFADYRTALSCSSVYFSVDIFSVLFRAGDLVDFPTVFWAHLNIISWLICSLFVSKIAFIYNKYLANKTNIYMHLLYVLPLDMIRFSCLVT